MFFRYPAVERRASFPPLLPHDSVSKDRSKQRRLWNISASRVVFAIACILTVAIWWSRRFLGSPPARVSGTRLKGVEPPTTRVVTSTHKPLQKSGKPSPSDAAAFEAVANVTSSRGISEAASNAAAVSSRSLSFHVCNGFANQRLSIVYAAIIAKETGRSLCLPRLLLDGTQHDTSVAATSMNSNATEFRTFYDVDVFFKGMKEAGVRVLDERFTFSSLSDQLAIVPSQDLQSLLEFGDSSPYSEAAHLSIECPLFRLGAAVAARHQELVESVLSSLIPDPAHRAEIENLKAGLSESSHYNVLHLRIERDWINHCETWESDRSNCLAEEVVRAIGKHLDLKGVSRGTPLYVACDVHTAEQDLLDGAMKSLRSMGYKKVTLLGEGKWRNKGMRRGERSSSNLSREIRAMHAYFLGMDSDKYIGNSVSTFSGLLLLERQNQKRWSTYYNMGGIPLMDMLPFFRMPWVFTYNGESPAFDYMVKSAVLSAIYIGQVIPYCIYMGDKGDEMYQWLKQQDVHVVLHDPSWKVNIAQKYDEAKKFAKAAATYESITSLVATFMRFDVPIVHTLYQYNYVLYTDIDVLFLKKIDLHSFPPALPEAMTMSYEMEKRFPCNAGVVLYNLPYMRRSYHDLVTFAMHTPGLHFGDKYGPADQGALNEFYEDEMGSQCSLPETFNAKPYRLSSLGNMDDVYILHFHGPKPKHYLDFARNRGCGPFSSAVGGGHLLWLCREGLQNICELRLDVSDSLRYEGAWDTLNKIYNAACKF